MLSVDLWLDGRVAEHELDLFTALVLEVFRLNGRLVEAGNELARPVGLNSVRWQVLGVVEHGPIPVAHVARVMGLSRQRVQKTADLLAESGFIIYGDNPHHRRAKLMKLTAKGEAALAEIAGRQAAWAAQLTGTHAPEALEEARTLLRLLREDLERDTPDY